MKHFTTIAVFTALLSAPVFSDDLGPDRAVELIEQGKIQHFRKLNTIVNDLHPEAKIVDTELEEEYGKYVYNVELHTADNREIEVDLDAASGEVLISREDD